MKTPIIYGDSVHSKGPYDVVVASKEENDYPTYAVINRQTGVVEFTHEVLVYARDWVKNFSKVLEEQILAESQVGPGEKGVQNLLQFPKVN